MAPGCRVLPYAPVVCLRIGSVGGVGHGGKRLVGAESCSRNEITPLEPTAVTTDTVGNHIFRSLAIGVDRPRYFRPRTPSFRPAASFSVPRRRRATRTDHQRGGERAPGARTITMDGLQTNWASGWGCGLHERMALKTQAHFVAQIATLSPSGAAGTLYD